MLFSHHVEDFNNAAKLTGNSAQIDFNIWMQGLYQEAGKAHDSGNTKECRLETLICHRETIQDLVSVDFEKPLCLVLARP